MRKASREMPSEWALEVLDKAPSPMMNTIAKLRDKYDLQMTVERYTGVETPQTENSLSENEEIESINNNV